MAPAEPDAATLSKRPGVDTKGEVKTQLARMEALVRDLLDYAKPWRIEKAEIDLAAAIA
ncbi:hypothetical protein [Paramagnetospirillum magneticum]|uniref:hypothetical protein n=1 Tax=Paramagnetospirillum magneticum TaxID=84159 RepID=UPI0002D96928|nr:hypothetical protein [Paramagnetospirillum magneticum]